MQNETHLYGRLHETLIRAKRILIVAHKKPDGDTLGSSSSFLTWLLREGKDVTAFCADAIPHPFRYLDNVHRYSHDPAIFEAQYDAVLVFDSGDLRYCGVADYMARLTPGYYLVNIDHHATNQHYGQMNIVCTDASSTAEVAYRFFETNKIAIDQKMATSILTGLLTDTGNFSNSGTTAGSMEAGSKMFASGARHRDIAAHLMNDKTISSLKLWGLALSRAQYNPKLDIISTYILKSDSADETSISEGLSNFLNAVAGQADTIMVLTEQGNGEVKGSLRSVKRDVSKLAQLMGGGGHKKAAGFTVKGKIELTPGGPRVREE